ncbi:MAG: T9SS type A sorting domain-containing protein [Bacteroidetes bacterium]|nr:T9SS type A sorting domain-containing protein [Bacteroidota bacterium]
MTLSQDIRQYRRMVRSLFDWLIRRAFGRLIEGHVSASAVSIRRLPCSVAVLCVVFMVGTISGHAQSRNDVDTVFRSSEPNDFRFLDFQISGDTIVGWVGNFNDALAKSWILFSTDAGNTWDSIPAPDSSVYQRQLPFQGICVIMLEYSTKTKRLFVSRDGKTFSHQSLLESGFPDVLIPERVLVNPHNSQELYLRGKTFDGSFDFMFKRSRDNGLWYEIKLPFHSENHGRSTRLDFDYSKPNRLWATIDGSRGRRYDFPDEYFYSDNEGESWIQVPTQIPVFMGVWGEDQGYEVTSNVSNGEFRALLVNPIAGRTDTLDWYTRIKHMLGVVAPGDSINSFDRVGSTILHYNSGVTFDPSNHDVVALDIGTVNVAMQTHTEWFLISTDRGLSWNVSDSVRQADSDAISSILQPSMRIQQSGQMYVSAKQRLGRVNEIEKTLIEFLLLVHRTGGVLSVQDKNESDVAIWPNPASGTLNIGKEAFTAYSVVDSRGSLITGGVLSDGSSDAFQLDVQSLAPGVYSLILQTETRSIVRRFCVIH